MLFDHKNQMLQFRELLLNWYQKNKADLPWRADWQRTKDPYYVLLSEIMLQQTVIKAVLPAYQKFVERLPSIDELAAADEGLVRSLVRGLGYYSRFQRLHRLAQVLKTRSKTKIEWPKSYDEWLELPGIGPYTAAAIASITLNQAHAVVDGNVERVLCRLNDLRQPVNAPELKPHYKKWAQSLLEPRVPGDFNQALMELGQKLCRKNQPDCGLCPVEPFCLAKARSTQHLAPQNKIRPTTKELNLVVTVPIHKGKIGILKERRSQRFLKETPGFPNRELGSIKKSKLRSQPSFTHTITQHKLTVYVETQWTDDVKSTKQKDETGRLEWKRQDEVEAHLSTQLDLKAWRLFQASKVLHKS